MCFGVGTRRARLTFFVLGLARRVTGFLFIQHADGTTPWCVGFESGPGTGWPGTDWIEDLVLRMWGPDVYDQWTSHKIPFNDERIVAAFLDTPCAGGRHARRVEKLDHLDSQSNPATAS